MRFVIQFADKDNFRWALSFGNATLESEHVAPKDCIVYHFNYHDGREMFEWKHGVVATDSFFDGAVESFNFWHMFVCRHHI